MKMIRIDLPTGSISIDAFPEKYRYLGGRGLTSTLLHDEVPADCDPLGSANKLVFAVGLLSGTSLVNSSRISIGAKSPLTGGIKESNVGGTISTALGRLGIGAIVVEGQTDQDSGVILRIDGDGQAELLPADAFRKMRTYDFVKAMLRQYGTKTAVLCIGPAGELGLKSASVQSSDIDDRPCRAAGRGGMGAVMGTKGLKAVVVDRGAKISFDYRDSDAFKKEARAFAGILRTHPLTSELLPKYGTAMAVDLINSAGAFACYNAREGSFAQADKINGAALEETIRKRGGQPDHSGCSQCIINCSNVYVDSQGDYVTGSLEYETIWSTGAMLGIADLDTIARLDFLCDDIGLDTINTGVAIAVAMDTGYCDFGDGRAAIELLEEIAQGTDLGIILGNGPVAVGKHFNHPRVPVVKNQAISAYDPRAIQGMAVTYATSPMGADHTAGYVVSENLAAGSKLDPLKAEGQVAVSRNAQVRTAFMDCTGLCSFATSALKNNLEGEESIVAMINHRHGCNWTHADIQRIGIEVLKAEKAFNRRAGFTAADDRMAAMFYKEPLPPNNCTVVVSDAEMDSTFDF